MYQRQLQPTNGSQYPYNSSVTGADTTPPDIVVINTDGAVNYTSEGGQVMGYNGTDWINGTGTDLTPTIRFTTNENADCEFNGTACSTTGSTSQVCTAGANITSVRTSTPTELRINCTNDAGLEGNWTTNDTYRFFYITNTIPSVSNVNITPGLAYINTTLSCNYTFTDGDSDSDQSTYRWFNQSGLIAVTTQTLSGAFSKGDNITCEVTPFDGFENGTSVNSSIRTILDSLPFVSDVNITPQPAYSYSTLNCTGNYTDLDGDSESGSSWKWWNSSSQIAVYGRLLNNSYFTYGDTIICTYIPSTGTVNGTGVNSSSLTITTLEISVSIVSCNITQWLPANASGGGFVPTNQTSEGCSFNITNDNLTYSATFQLLYNGSLSYFPSWQVETFHDIYGRYDVDQKSWVNNTYNWTRWCIEATDYTLNYSQGLDSMKVKLNFNNTYNNRREYYNGSAWLNTTPTFSCNQSNYVKFNTTRGNYTAYNTAYLDYRLGASTNLNTSIRLIIVNGSTDTDTSSYSVVSSVAWNTLSLTLSSGLNNITGFKVQFNGTDYSEVLVDNLRFNDTTGEQKLWIYAGSTNYSQSTQTISGGR